MSKHLPLPNGTELQGRYRVVKQLGKGGMGVVYEAIDKRVGATVALKETFPDDESSRTAFEHEVKLLANLHHEALPRVMDFFIEHRGQINEGHYLIMEYVDGRDLYELLKTRGSAFDVRQVLDWADQVLDALEYLHENGIIHRDIKPQNLKCSSRGKIKLLDFGIAKGVIEDITTMQKNSMPAATLCYAPLEQVLRASSDAFQILDVNFHDKTMENFRKGTNARSDLYALGATLYQLLTNRVPVKAYIRASSKWLGKGDNLPSVGAINASVSERLAAIIARAMEIESENRFHSASEMRVYLSKISEHGAARAERAADRYLTNKLPPLESFDANFSKTFENSGERDLNREEELRLTKRFSDAIRKAERLGFYNLLDNFSVEVTTLNHESIDRLEKMVDIESEMLQTVVKKEKEKRDKREREEKIRRANEIWERNRRRLIEEHEKLCIEQKEAAEFGETHRRKTLLTIGSITLTLMGLVVGAVAFYDPKFEIGAPTSAMSSSSVGNVNLKTTTKSKKLK